MSRLGKTEISHIEICLIGMAQVWSLAEPKDNLRPRILCAV